MRVLALVMVGFFAAGLLTGRWTMERPSDSEPKPIHRWCTVTHLQDVPPVLCSDTLEQCETRADLTNGETCK